VTLFDPEPPLARQFEPVTIVHVQDHPFKDRGPNKVGCGRVLGDGTECRMAANAPLHFGFPPSYNATPGRRSWTGDDQKFRWTEYLQELLNKAGMPRPADPARAKYLVEGEWTFPRKPARGGRRGPDQGNFRTPVEKAMGDALEGGGWLEGDYWLAYEFGNATLAYEKGVSALRLTVFPVPFYDPFAAA
jgi:hypothetical protein